MLVSNTRDPRESFGRRKSTHALNGVQIRVFVLVQKPDVEGFDSIAEMMTARDVDETI